MTLVSWMVAGSVLSALGFNLLSDTQTDREVWLGMIAPLVAAVGTRIAIERKYKREPLGLTALMIKAFGAKMVFFGGYITLALQFGRLRPIPFVISFTSYFIALHITEAVSLHRLSAGTRVSAGTHRN